MKTFDDGDMLVHAQGGPAPSEKEVSNYDEVRERRFMQELSVLEASLETPAISDIRKGMLEAAIRTNPALEGLMNEELERSNIELAGVLKMAKGGEMELPGDGRYTDHISTGSIIVTRTAPYNYKHQFATPPNPPATQVGTDPGKGRLFSSAVMGGSLGKGVAGSQCGIGIYIKPLVQKCHVSAWACVESKAYNRTQTYFSEALSHSRYQISLEKYNAVSGPPVEWLNGDIVTIGNRQTWWPPGDQFPWGHGGTHYMDVVTVANPGDWFIAWISQITLARANGGAASWAYASLESIVPWFGYSIW